MQLEPDEQVPPECFEVAQLWIVSQVCNAFGCLPDDARKALDDDYNGSIFQILDLRALADAKSRLERADPKDPPTDYQVQRYMQLMMGVVGSELDVDTSGPLKV